jgi:mono/diheme cytochrome c family protein
LRKAFELQWRGALEVKIIRVTLAMYAICLLPMGVSAQTQNSSLVQNPVYQRDCAKCHGKTATGRHFGGPSLASPSVAATSGDDLRNIIGNGKGHMPKFAGKLTPEEIDQLVAQIKALTKQ